jgi:hypothetical protein
MKDMSVMLGWFGCFFHTGFFGRKPKSSQPFFAFANLYNSIFKLSLDPMG